MSFLFHKRTQKVMKWVWIGVSAIIIASMIIVYVASGFQ